jgi:polygalacturonase
VELARVATVRFLLPLNFLKTNISIGLSIGSVGGRSDNVVKTVTISGSTIKDSQNGVRIKTVSGATGSVSGVTYKDITLSGITKYGIVIEQDYEVSRTHLNPTVEDYY